MRITDAQVHLWAGGTPSGHHRQVSAFSATELLAEMAAAGVDAAVIHPPSWDPGGNELAVDAVRDHPGRFAILGHFPLDQPESRETIRHWKERPGMLGLRWSLTRPHQHDWAEDGTMDWLWPEAERLDLPVATMAWRFLPVFARIAERHPRLRLLIDHLGWVRTIHDPLHRMFDAFGPDRFFWGTDITRMPCSYRQCVTLFTEELPFLAGRDLERVMGEGMRDWIDWRD